MMQRILVYRVAIPVCTVAVLLAGMLALETRVAYAMKTRAAGTTEKLLECSGNETADFSPGITNSVDNTDTISITSEIKNCTIGGSGLAPATGTGTFTASTACNDVTDDPDVETFTWANNDKSVVNWTTATVAAIKVGAEEVVKVVKTGTVESGLGAGSSATATVELSSSAAKCSSTGITSIIGSFTTVFGV